MKKANKKSALILQLHCMDRFGIAPDVFLLSSWGVRWIMSQPPVLNSEYALKTLFNFSAKIRLC